MSGDSDRSAGLAHALRAVRLRIAAACDASGRDPAEVSLIVVTKTFPAADVRRLADLGVTDVGENRVQEFLPKKAECADLALRWHFVGQVQSNKAAAVVNAADVVHSVDRLKLVRAMHDAAVGPGRAPLVLLQVDLDDSPGEPPEGRGGARPEQLAGLAEAVSATHHLHLGGVMAVAPLGGEPSRAFHRLAEISAELRRTYPGAAMISAGMSDDLETAVAAGATHLRIGSAVLGSRAPLG